MNIESNTINHKYVEEIQNCCNRNKNIQKKCVLPKFKEELVKLVEIAKENGGLE